MAPFIAPFLMTFVANLKIAQEDESSAIPPSLIEGAKDDGRGPSSDGDGGGDGGGSGGGGIVTGSISAIERAMPDWPAFRLNWGRTLAALFAPSNEEVCELPIVKKLVLRMQDATERSLYVDSLDDLLKEHMIAFEAAWFRDELLHAYANSVADRSSSAASAVSLHCLEFLKIPMSLPMNLHRDCPNEEPRLRESSLGIIDEMIDELGAHVVATIKPLWEQVHALETQSSPIEAARRTERMLLARKKGEGGLFFCLFV